MTPLSHMSIKMVMRAAGNLDDHKRFIIDKFLIEEPLEITSMQEKMAILKVKLANFLHSYNCQKQRGASDGGRKKCGVKLCNTISKSWDHLKLCHEDELCSVAFCIPTKKLLLHWFSCGDVGCVVCNDFPNTYIASPVKVRSPVKRLRSATTFHHGNPFQWNKYIKPKCEKKWTREELIQAFMPQLNRLFALEKESDPFMRSVDPQEDLCPDYFEIVRRPMDFGTIMNKMDSGVYQEPWQLVNDVYLIFGNAWLYNKRCSIHHKYACKLADVFEANIDLVMRRLGFCCGQRYEYTPLCKYCDSRLYCNIPVLADYYSYNDTYSFCECCFHESPSSSTVSIHTDAQPLIVEKASFVKKRNLERKLERFIACSYCGRQNHVVCVMHVEEIDTPPFICQLCRSTPPTPEASPTPSLPTPTYQPVLYKAKDIPVTHLSVFMEKRVNRLLRERGVEGGGVVVRVVSSAAEVSVVKPRFKACFPAMPSHFPYTSKVIFVFQRNNSHQPPHAKSSKHPKFKQAKLNKNTHQQNIQNNNNTGNNNNQGLDVCFFGMHVQEYGSDAGAPNCRRVYLAYLDSVQYFQPAHLRTAVYHHLLLAYMHYIKNMGFISLHIWSCPPSEGDDYIFNCHPRCQKVPKARRLQEWYKKLLNKAKLEGVVEDYTDILTYASSSNLRDPSHLPYFCGDFWPSSIEEHIREVHRMGDPGVLVDKTGPRSKGAGGRSDDKHLSSTAEGALVEKMYNTLTKFKEMFFVVTLRSTTPSEPIIDPDPPSKTDLLHERFTCLMASRQRQAEFSSLRRAKHSTQFILRQLLRSSADVSMETEGQEGKGRSAVDMLEHASHCQGGSECLDTKCALFKNAIAHASTCADRSDCVFCHSFITLVLCHARRCGVGGGSVGAGLRDGGEAKDGVENYERVGNDEMKLQLEDTEKDDKALVLTTETLEGKEPKSEPESCDKVLKADENKKEKTKCRVLFCKVAKRELEKMASKQRKMGERLVMRRTAAVMESCSADAAGSDDQMEDFHRMGSL